MVVDNDDFRSLLDVTVAQRYEGNTTVTDQELPIWAEWNFDHWKCVRGNSVHGYADIPWPLGFPVDKLPIPKYKIGSVVKHAYAPGKSLTCTIIEIDRILIEKTHCGASYGSQISEDWWILNLHYTVRSSWHNFWAKDENILEVYSAGDGFLH
jgi:hypothetical protein